MMLEHIRWDQDSLMILDQTLLPQESRMLRLTSMEEVWEAIKVLRVRGAPAIGIAAAFGLCLGLRRSAPKTQSEFNSLARKHADFLASSRPTAVNLRWAVDRMCNAIQKASQKGSSEDLDKVALEEAFAIHKEDNEMCLAIGRFGSTLLRDGARVLTHCNAGGLATGRFGTALAPIYEAARKGQKISVMADETRPLWQGARLTAYELQQAGIPVTIICDNMAGAAMAQGRIDLVIVGADRIAANGDFANKIGTYQVAILAKEHKIPFYCAAPYSTIDMSLPNGKGIPIEEREEREVTRPFGRPLAPEGVPAFNPAFDVTPARFVTAFITEKGVIHPPFDESFRKFYAAG
jgi:methylthioribose-1-phosphate isomerase